MSVALKSSMRNLGNSDRQTQSTMQTIELRILAYPSDEKSKA